jgi:phospholipase/carboxylesterase
VTGTPDDAVLEATATLLPALLSTLEALAWVGRRLHPPDLPGLAASMAAFGEPLAAARSDFRAVAWPDSLIDFRDAVLASAEAALGAVEGFGASARDPNGTLRAYRALRQSTRAVEALYPLTAGLPPVNRFFVDPDRREDAALLARLAGGAAGRDDVGVMHAQNERGERGGVSVYVPEDYDAGSAHPLLVALHGGSGHGRDFLWTWLREARTRGCILMSPTSVGDTWSLMEPHLDGERLVARIERAAAHWSIDRSRILLTGMSDGGTMSLLAGVAQAGPWTHVAPISGSFHPMILEGARDLRGLPVYLVHGALDWMFPVEMARATRDALTAVGAAVHYREIEDLSHTYPREENARILDWLLS